MLKLIIFNCILIGLCIVGLILCKKFVKTEKAKRRLLIIVALATVVCHYSSLVYHQIVEGTPMNFLKSNPNLILPIYPCNVVMWSCLIFAFCKFNTKFSKCLADFLLLLGVACALVGMFANTDYFRNPTLLNYDVTKGIIAHITLLFNVLLLPTLGFFKLDLPRNMLSLGLSVIGMFLIGCYCNLVFATLGSSETAYSVNSMFILHSPFDGIDFLTYPIISLVAIVGYFIILLIAEQIKYPKGERWYNRIRNRKGNISN